MSLTLYEQETIINFNKLEPHAVIFTYEKTWQQHLEKKVGLIPVADNGFGGKTYNIPKSRIKPPSPKRVLSDAQKRSLAKARATLYDTQVAPSFSVAVGK